MKSHPKPEIILEDLIYELEMFCVSMKLLESGEVHKYEKNLVIDSFVIHGRSIIDFLFKTSNNNDDAQAWHFYGDCTKWFKICNFMPIHFCLMKKKANKLLAHLSYSRQGEFKNLGWEFVETGNWLCYFTIQFIFTSPNWATLKLRNCFIQSKPYLEIEVDNQTSNKLLDDLISNRNNGKIDKLIEEIEFRTT